VQHSLDPGDWMPLCVQAEAHANQKGGDVKQQKRKQAGEPANKKSKRGGPGNGKTARGPAAAAAAAAGKPSPGVPVVQLKLAAGEGMKRWFE